MSAIYYLDANRQKVGPIDTTELTNKNISPETLVWMPGLTTWTAAKDVKELSFLFATSDPIEATTVYVEKKETPETMETVVLNSGSTNQQPTQPQQPVQYQQPVYPQSPQQQYGAPYQGQQSADYPQGCPMPTSGVNTCGAIGLVTALLAFFAWMPIFGFISTWLTALIFSIIGVCRKSKGMAIAGLIICLIMLFIIIALYATMSDYAFWRMVLEYDL